MTRQTRKAAERKTYTSTVEGRITVDQFIAGEAKDRPVFLMTAWGPARVSYIRWPESNPWAVCPDLNGGHGQSFMVGRGDLLWLDASAAQADYDARQSRYASAR